MSTPPTPPDYIGRFNERGELLETLQGEEPFDDWVPLTGWTGWQARPSPLHRAVSDGAGGIVWHDPRTLDDLKAARWAAIKNARAAAIDAPLATPYGTFDCGPADRTNITDAIALLQTLAAAGTPTTVTFTTADNGAVTLTTADMVHIGLLLGQRVQAAYATARSLRAQIDAAQAAEDLAAIHWPAPA